MSSTMRSPSEPEALLTGALQDGRRVLVTVFRDGGEIAFRDNEAGTWSPPSFLHRMDGVGVRDGEEG